MALSIIIPTFNEAEALPKTLANIAALEPSPLEVILADASSTDDTVAIAKAAGLTVLENVPKGRAAQMNAGAAIARGDQICFLHADTKLPADFISLAGIVLADEKTALAGFISIMRGENKVRPVTSAHNFVKTWYIPALTYPLTFYRGVRLLFGDQVMICRRADFEAVGGFDATQRIMEEADLCLRMVRAGRGRVRQVNRKVWSSDRRVAEWGFWRANATYLYVGIMWGLGAKQERLTQIYRDIR